MRVSLVLVKAFVPVTFRRLGVFCKPVVACFRPVVALVALTAVVGVGLVPDAAAEAYDAKPKLVVILVIDQFRGDYLDRYQDSFKTEDGFNLFLKQGAYFGSCYYDYANTKTAPGHATIGTGAYTDGHGIGSNEWWDMSRNTKRMVSSVEDERYRMVGTFEAGAAAQEGASPRNLRATTIGDEVRLATKGEAKLYGVSLKDRAAIMPSGQTANGAFWIDQATGRFETSTYYMDKLPEWATRFNEGPAVGAAVKAAGLAKTAKFYNDVGATPAANAYELAFAEALVEGEALGKHKVTDVLTVSLSANDILGHEVGPDADAEKAMVLALDRDIDGFVRALEEQVGAPNLLVALTADHGVAPIPAESAKLGVASASLDLKALAAKLDEALNAKFSPGAKKAYLMPVQELPYLALDSRAFGTVPEAEAEQAVVEALPAAVASQGASAAQGYAASRESAGPADPQLAFVRSKVDLMAGKIPATEFGRLIAHSLMARGGWYVMAFPTAYQMETLKGIQTTHYSPWSYDRHVPLGFFGAAIKPGRYAEQVAPVDIAATFASILGVNAPSASVGRVLTWMIQPVAW
jgi:predicted AlkP superfamily pyrophosphatase or phosphodiesterase